MWISRLSATLSIVLALGISPVRADLIPQVDDPQVYLMVLEYHDSIMATLPPEGQQRELALKRAAAHFNMSTPDFLILHTLSQQLQLALAAQRVSAITYSEIQKKSGRPESPREIARYEQQRLNTIRASISSIQKALTPTGWVTFRSYVNDDFRKHIAIKAIK